jgi:hypothetical protein
MKPLKIGIVVVLSLGLGLAVRFAYEQLINGDQSPENLSSQFAKVTSQGLSDTWTRLFYQTNKPGEKQNLLPPNVLMAYSKDTSGLICTTSDDVSLTLESAQIDKMTKRGGEVTEQITWKHWGFKYALKSSYGVDYNGKNWDVTPIDHEMSVKPL